MPSDRKESESLSLAEKLLKAYEISNRSLDFSETKSQIAAMEWAEKIINKLKETQDAIVSNDWEDAEEFTEPWLVFTEMPDNAVPITDRNALHLLRSIIESIYTAGITAIRYAYVDRQDNIRCGFEDRISPSRTLGRICKLKRDTICSGKKMRI